MLPLFYRQLSFRELSNLHKKAQLLNGLHGMCTHLPLTPAGAYTLMHYNILVKWQRTDPYHLTLTAVPDKPPACYKLLQTFETSG